MKSNISGFSAKMKMGVSTIFVFQNSFTFFFCSKLHISLAEENLKLQYIRTVMLGTTFISDKRLVSFRKRMYGTVEEKFHRNN